MRMVNKNLSLPDPTPWSKVVLDGLKRRIIMITETLNTKKPELGRVSLYEEG